MQRYWIYIRKIASSYDEITSPKRGYWIVITIKATGKTEKLKLYEQYSHGEGLSCGVIPVN